MFGLKIQFQLALSSNVLVNISIIVYNIIFTFVLQHRSHLFFLRLKEEEKKILKAHCQ